MKMGLLRSVKDVPGIDYYEYRDWDYYSKFAYRARFTLEGIRYTYYAKTPDDIKIPVKTIPKVKSDRIIGNQDILRKYVVWRNTNITKTNKDIRVRMEHNTVAIFSNNLELLQTLRDIDPIVSVDITKSEPNQFVGVKSFVRQPKHKFRVYLKSKRVDVTFYASMLELLKNTKGLYPSGAMRDWLKSGHQSGISRTYQQWRYIYSSSNYYFDYDDESLLSYLGLMHGEMLGKRYKLEKRPDTV